MANIRDYGSTIVVRLDRVAELKVSKFGRRTYLLVDNTSANPIKFDWNVAPGQFNGTTLAPGVRYERTSPDCPQGTLFVIGTQATDQVVNVAQGFAD